MAKADWGFCIMCREWKILRGDNYQTYWCLACYRNLKKCILEVTTRCKPIEADDIGREERVQAHAERVAREEPLHAKGRRGDD